MRNWLLFVLILGVMLTGCAPQAPAASENDAPQVVIRAITTEPGGLDPQGLAGAGQNAILPYLFDTLIYRDIDNSYKPYLAETWNVSADGREVVFTLKEGIVFHDGTPLNAEAVKFTFDRVREQGQRSVLAAMAMSITNIEAVDDLTVRFDLRAPSSTFFSSLTTAYAGIISPKAAQENGEGFAQKPVGSGAFMLEKWEPGVAITLVKNPNYAWAPDIVKNQAAPHIDRLVFKIIPDVAQQISAYQAGEVDILFVNQPNHLARLKQDPNTNLVETTLHSLIYLGYHAQKPPFNDTRVRQAFSHAVNKEEVLKTAVGGIGEVAFAPLASSLPGFDPSLKPAELGYDLEKAQGLLVEAGFNQAEDGSWTKDGKPLALTLLTSTRPPNGAIATVLQSQFKALGVAVEVQQLDATAVQDAAAEGKFDMLLWRYDWSDADVLRTYLSTERIGRTNRTFYSNPELDALLEEAVAELDDDRRNALYLEAQKLILQDAPWQPLYVPKDYMATRKEVSGIVMGPMGRMLLNDATKQ